jgi:hypothetical protein
MGRERDGQKKKSYGDFVDPMELDLDALAAPPPPFPPEVVPVLIEEQWVECDKCQKWRLLPPGSSVPPENIPWCVRERGTMQRACL